MKSFTNDYGDVSCTIYPRLYKKYFCSSLLSKGSLFQKHSMVFGDLILATFIFFRKIPNWNYLLCSKRKQATELPGLTRKNLPFKHKRKKTKELRCRPLLQLTTMLHCQGGAPWVPPQDIWNCAENSTGKACGPGKEQRPPSTGLSKKSYLPIGDFDGHSWDGVFRLTGAAISWAPWLLQTQFRQSNSTTQFLETKKNWKKQCIFSQEKFWFDISPTSRCDFSIWELNGIVMCKSCFWKPLGIPY